MTCPHYSKERLVSADQLLPGSGGWVARREVCSGAESWAPDLQDPHMWSQQVLILSLLVLTPLCCCRGPGQGLQGPLRPFPLWFFSLPGKKIPDKRSSSIFSGFCPASSKSPLLCILCTSSCSPNPAWLAPNLALAFQQLLVINRSITYCALPSANLGAAHLTCIACKGPRDPLALNWKSYRTVVTTRTHNGYSQFLYFDGVWLNWLHRWSRKLEPGL